MICSLGRGRNLLCKLHTIDYNDHHIGPCTVSSLLSWSRLLNSNFINAKFEFSMMINLALLIRSIGAHALKVGASCVNRFYLYNFVNGLIFLMFVIRGQGNISFCDILCKGSVCECMTICQVCKLTAECVFIVQDKDYSNC